MAEQEAILRFQGKDDGLSKLLSATTKGLEDLNNRTLSATKSFVGFKKEDPVSLFDALGKSASSAAEGVEGSYQAIVRGHRNLSTAAKATISASEVLDSRMLQLGANLLGVGNNFRTVSDTVVPLGGFLGEVAEQTTFTGKAFTVLDAVEQPVITGLERMAQFAGNLSQKLANMGGMAGKVAPIMGSLSSSLLVFKGGIGMADLAGDIYRTSQTAQELAQSLPDLATVTDTVGSTFEKTGIQVKYFGDTMTTTRTVANLLTKTTEGIPKEMSKAFLSITEIGVAAAEVMKVANAVQATYLEMQYLNEGLGVFKAAGVNTDAAELAIEVATMGTSFVTSADQAQKFFNVAVGGFLQLEDKISTITTLTAGYQAGTEQLYSTISELVSGPLKNQIDSIQAVDPFYNTLSAGITDIGEASQFMTAGLKLASSTGADTGQTLELLAKTTKAYGLSNRDAAKTAAQIYGVVEEGITTFPKLTGGLSRAASVAANSGVKFEEFLGSIAALTRTMTTDDSLTGYASLLQAVAAQGEQSAQTVSEMGIKFDVNSVKTKGLVASLQELYKASGGSTEKLKKVIPDSLAFQTAMQLMTTAGNDAVSIMENVGEMSSESLDSLFDRRRDTVIQKLTATMNGFSEVWVDLGRRVFPALEPAVDFLERLLEVYQGLPEPVKNAMAATVVFGAAMRQGSKLNQIAISTVLDLAKTYLMGRAASLLFRGELFKEVGVIKDLIVSRQDYLGALLRVFGIEEKQVKNVKSLTAAQKLQQQSAKGLSSVYENLSRVLTSDADTIVSQMNRVEGSVRDSVQNIKSRATELTRSIANGLNPQDIKKKAAELISTLNAAAKPSEEFSRITGVQYRLPDNIKNIQNDADNIVRVMGKVEKAYTQLESLPESPLKARLMEEARNLELGLQRRLELTGKTRELVKVLGAVDTRLESERSKLGSLSGEQLQKQQTIVNDLEKRRDRLNALRKENADIEFKESQERLQSLYKQERTNLDNIRKFKTEIGKSTLSEESKSRAIAQAEQLRKETVERAKIFRQSTLEGRRATGSDSAIEKENAVKKINESVTNAQKLAQEQEAKARAASSFVLKQQTGQTLLNTAATRANANSKLTMGDVTAVATSKGEALTAAIAKNTIATQNSTLVARAATLRANAFGAASMVAATGSKVMSGAMAAAGYAAKTLWTAFGPLGLILGGITVAAQLLGDVWADNPLGGAASEAKRLTTELNMLAGATENNTKALAEYKEKTREYSSFVAKSVIPLMVGVEGLGRKINIFSMLNPNKKQVEENRQKRIQQLRGDWDDAIAVQNGAFEALDRVQSRVDRAFEESVGARQKYLKQDFSSSEAQLLKDRAVAEQRALTSEEAARVLELEKIAADARKKNNDELISGLQKQAEAAKNPAIKEALNQSISQLMAEAKALDEATKKQEKYFQNIQAVTGAIEKNNAARSAAGILGSGSDTDAARLVQERSAIEKQAADAQKMIADKQKQLQDLDGEIAKVVAKDGKKADTSGLEAQKQAIASEIESYQKTIDASRGKLVEVSRELATTQGLMGKIESGLMETLKSAPQEVRDAYGQVFDELEKGMDLTGGMQRRSAAQLLQGFSEFADNAVTAVDPNNQEDMNKLKQDADTFLSRIGEAVDSSTIPAEVGKKMYETMLAQEVEVDGVKGSILSSGQIQEVLEKINGLTEKAANDRVRINQRAISEINHLEKTRSISAEEANVKVLAEQEKMSQVQIDAQKEVLENIGKQYGKNTEIYKNQVDKITEIERGLEQNKLQQKEAALAAESALVGRVTKLWEDAIATNTVNEIQSTQTIMSMQEEMSRKKIEFLEKEIAARKAAGGETVELERQLMEERSSLARKEYEDKLKLMEMEADKAMDLVRLSQVQRKTQLQELDNRGQLSEGQKGIAETNANTEKLNAELRIEKQKLEVIRQQGGESDARREQQIKVAELTLSLAEQEKAVQEATLRLAEEKLQAQEQAVQRRNIEGQIADQQRINATGGRLDESSLAKNRADRGISLAKDTLKIEKQRYNEMKKAGATALELENQQNQIAQRRLDLLKAEGDKQQANLEAQRKAMSLASEVADKGWDLAKKGLKPVMGKMGLSETEVELEELKGVLEARQAALKKFEQLNVVPMQIEQKKQEILEAEYEVQQATIAVERDRVERSQKLIEIQSLENSASQQNLLQSEIALKQKQQEYEAEQNILSTLEKNGARQTEIQDQQLKVLQLGKDIRESIVAVEKERISRNQSLFEIQSLENNASQQNLLQSEVVLKQKEQEYQVEQNILSILKENGARQTEIQDQQLRVLQLEKDVRESIIAVEKERISRNQRLLEIRFLENNASQRNLLQSEVLLKQKQQEYKAEQNILSILKKNGARQTEIEEQRLKVLQLEKDVRESIIAVERDRVERSQRLLEIETLKAQISGREFLQADRDLQQKQQSYQAEQKILSILQRNGARQSEIEEQQLRTLQAQQEVREAILAKEQAQIRIAQTYQEIELLKEQAIVTELEHQVSLEETRNKNVQLSGQLALKVLELESSILDAKQSQLQVDSQLTTQAIEFAGILADPRLGEGSRQAIEGLLSAMGMAGQSQEELVNRRADNEQKILEMRRRQLSLQQETARSQLEMERVQTELSLKQEQIRAKTAVTEAEIAKSRAAAAESQARATLSAARERGDREAIAQAEKDLVEAQQGVESAENQIELAEENLSISEETARLQEEMLQIQEQNLDVQQKAAREQLEAEINQERLTKGLEKAQGLLQKETELRQLSREKLSQMVSAQKELAAAQAVTNQAGIALQQSIAQGQLSLYDRALQLQQRLKDESLDPKVKEVIEKQLAAAGLAGADEAKLLQIRQQKESELLSLQEQQTIAKQQSEMRQLEFEATMQKLRDREQIDEAKINVLQAEREKREAELAKIKAQKSRDPELIALAEQQVALATQGIDAANARLSQVEQEVSLRQQLLDQQKSELALRQQAELQEISINKQLKQQENALARAEAFAGARNGFGGFRFAGGEVTPGKAYIGGELGIEALVSGGRVQGFVGAGGAELFKVPQPSMVVPHHETMKMMIGSMNHNVKASLSDDRIVRAITTNTHAMQRALGILVGRQPIVQNYYEGARTTNESWRMGRIGKG